MNTYKLLFAGIFLFLLLACMGCQDDGVTTDRNYQLVWSDDFEGTAGQSPDAGKWIFENGVDWGNAQLEFTTDRPENASLDGEGNLAIIARSENYGGRAFTSARISTRGKFSQTYGRFEARIKMPYGPGLWPAFWMIGESCIPQTFDNGVCCNGYDGWPNCGEIDIVEMRGQAPMVAHGSAHGPGYSGGNPVSKSFSYPDNRFDKDFHIYAVEWGEGFIDYFVDDNLYQRITPEDVSGEWVYDQPFFIVLNLAVGGNYVGFPTADTQFPQTMLVDYVKVYREQL
ncbi:MAG: glycoside hydrolase family 16 protein [Bacteroidia bacterium]